MWKVARQKWLSIYKRTPIKLAANLSSKHGCQKEVKQHIQTAQTYNLLMSNPIFTKVIFQKWKQNKFLDKLKWESVAGIHLIKNTRGSSLVLKANEPRQLFESMN